MPVTNQLTKQPMALRDPTVQDLLVRVGRLEEDNHFKNTELAVIKTDMGYVKESVGKISAGLSRLLWLIIATEIVAVITFGISGGFAPI